MSTRKPRGAAAKTEQAAQPEPTKPTKPARQQKIGRVTSDKMQKTIVVAVESLKQHRVYKRTYKFTTRFKAHDERDEARIGDMVRIEETRPLSKEKRWRLVEILKRAEQTVAPEVVAAELEQSVGLTPQSDER